MRTRRIRACLAKNDPESTRHQLLTPRGFALTMITLGIGTLLAATTIQHIRDVRALEQQFGSRRVSVAAFVASGIALLGVVALILVALGG